MGHWTPTGIEPTDYDDDDDDDSRVRHTRVGRTLEYATLR